MSCNNEGMRNQISGSISLDVSTLADAIAERLKSAPPAPPALSILSPAEASEALAEALTFAIGQVDTHTTLSMLRRLERAGVTLARLPQETTREALQEAHPSWFERTKD